MVIKKIYLSILFTIVLLLSSVKAIQAGFGISPGSIMNDHLKPGATVEQLITLSRSDPKEDLTVTVEPELGEMDSWFEFIPGRKFTFPVNKNEVEVKAIIKVPEDAVLKKYDGIIRVKAASAENRSSGVSVVKGARMEVKLVTTTVNLTKLNIRLMKISDFKTKEALKLTLTTENIGNIPATPSKVSLEIKTLQDKSLETLEAANLENVPPHETQDLSVIFHPTVSPGQYFAYVKAYLDQKIIAQDRLVFTVTGEVQETTSKSNASILNTLKQGVSYYQKTLAILALAILLLILILIILSKKAKPVIRISCALIVTVTLVFTLYTYFSQKLKPADLITDPPKTEDSSGSVKGVVSKDKETSNNPALNFKPLIIKNNGVSTYPIYDRPEFESKIVYYAKENENFFILEEMSEWYLVRLSGGEDGWLPKYNAKSVQKENR